MSKVLLSLTQPLPATAVVASVIPYAYLKVTVWANFHKPEPVSHPAQGRDRRTSQGFDLNVT